MTNLDLLDEIEKLKVRLSNQNEKRRYQPSKLDRFKHEVLVLHRMGESLSLIQLYLHHTHQIIAS